MVGLIGTMSLTIAIAITQLATPTQAEIRSDATTGLAAAASGGSSSDVLDIARAAPNYQASGAAGDVVLSTFNTPTIGVIVAKGAHKAEVVNGAIFLSETAVHTDLVTRALEDGVQMVAVFADPGAPRSLTFRLSLPKGSQLALQADGSIAVSAPVAVETPRPGEVIATTTKVETAAVAKIATPWAVDAKGHMVQTSYAVTGNTVRQLVHPDTSAVYPLTVDPKITTQWWGWQIELSNKQTNKLVKAITVAAGVVGLAAALQAAGIVTAGSGAVTGVAAGLLAIGAAAIDLCNWNDKGVYINVTRVGVGWCWPR